MTKYVARGFPARQSHDRPFVTLGPEWPLCADGEHIGVCYYTTPEGAEEMARALLAAAAEARGEKKEGG